jgi:hypothetical protein
MRIYWWEKWAAASLERKIIEILLEICIAIRIESLRDGFETRKVKSETIVWKAEAIGICKESIELQEDEGKIGRNPLFRYEQPINYYQNDRLVRAISYAPRIAREVRTVFNGGRTCYFTQWEDQNNFSKSKNDTISQM